ncbi:MULTISPECIES: HD domain-containing phosphohydrolase [unclassified Romboutsia]|uniref:HD domain-containing phosphohydrolase n=1 Tax=unclassified Romboutsia TaxID=2626894 RepID=UPI0008225EE1|nr:MULTISPECIES: HD domain-containing phosphohydrolase [unclassified Romboutsia]SCH50909.1 Cyclic di-GMP phosphodiesterase response regulator RpfG [uncultured Clostridium sp.]
MELISVLDLLSIVQGIMKLIKPEIVEHGKEVAYISYKIGEKLGYSKKQLYYLIITGEIHDLGAYKTENIDCIDRFRYKDSNRHSYYGYVLLKHSKGLSNCASTILYHHCSYKNFNDKIIKDIPVPDDAFLISLGDKISLICNNEDYNKEEIINKIKSINKEDFNPVHFEILMDLISNENLIDNIISGEYKKEINQVVNNSYIKVEQATEYLTLIPLGVDLYSYETALHTISVAFLAKKVSKSLGLKDEDIMKIEISSYLHDLGKVGIPKYILEKEGPLTFEEFELMKRHVLFTRQLLEEANIDKDIISMACNHHEKLDGSGYPIGIDSSELSIGDRIISVCDIFCALTEKRHYKDAFSKEKIYNIISQMADNGLIDKNICNHVMNDYDNLNSYLNNLISGFENAIDSIKKEYNSILKYGEENNIKIY